MAEARYQWRQAGPIQVSETTSNGDAEIFVSDVNNCNLPWIGIYDYATDDVYFNRCAKEWAGGNYPGTQVDDNDPFDPTPASRRKRTAVHEFGHAQGLDHNGRDDCASVMSNVLQDLPTCWVPKRHDVNDINDYR